MVRVAALLCLAALAAGCGSSSHTSRATATTTAKTCTSAQAARRKIEADIVRLREAARGTPVDRATDRFLLDVATAPISNLARNRLIDHAAAAVSTKCPQCFQAMESARPIPAIAHGDNGCT